MNKEKIRIVFTQLWQMALETDDEPAEDDDFFDCGGNSYKAFFIMTNLPEEYKGLLEMDDFYDYETFSGILNRMAEKSAQV